MRFLLLTVLTTVLVCGGCSHVLSIGDGGTADADTDTDSDTDSDSDTDTDTDTDTGPNECTQDLGEYSGDFEITTPSDVATLAGYTSISGSLYINCLSCTDLSELVCLTSVGVYFRIEDNDDLTNLDGLSGITSVGGELFI